MGNKFGGTRYHSEVEEDNEIFDLWLDKSRDSKFGTFKFIYNKDTTVTVTWIGSCEVDGDDVTLVPNTCVAASAKGTEEEKVTHYRVDLENSKMQAISGAMLVPKSFLDFSATLNREESSIQVSYWIPKLGTNSRDEIIAIPSHDRTLVDLFMRKKK